MATKKQETKKAKSNRKSVVTTDEITPKEKRIFFSGLSVGIVGGFIGNMLTGYLMNFSKEPNWIDAFGAILFSMIFLGVLFWINKQIKKNK